MWKWEKSYEYIHSNDQVKIVVYPTLHEVKI